MGDELPVEMVPAGRWRDWMQATSSRFANRCLPLLVANQSGWWLLNPYGFEATWAGADDRGSVTVAYDAPEPPPERRLAVSHFGYGILSFNFRLFFETPEGFNVHARGPANMPKDGIGPLEGVVETDWTIVPFTMNWKFTRPGTIRFEQGEPFCQIAPVRRGELERFVPTARSLDGEPEGAMKASVWEATRAMFAIGKRRMADAGDETFRRQWMEDYFRGKSPGGDENPAHQTTLRLKGLTNERVPK
jgi:hypothetical protein